MAPDQTLVVPFSVSYLRIGTDAANAALLALAGTGVYGSVPEACRAAIRETASVSPIAADAAFYEKAHRIYQSLYPALQPACAAIAHLG